LLQIRSASSVQRISSSIVGEETVKVRTMLRLFRSCEDLRRIRRRLKDPGPTTGQAEHRFGSAARLYLDLSDQHAYMYDSSRWRDHPCRLIVDVIGVHGVEKLLSSHDDDASPA
jgi:hypothetical protein